MRLLLPIALLAACGPTERCLDACEGLGIERSSERCRELCTESCETLARTYGINEQRCEEMQSESPPSAAR